MTQPRMNNGWFGETPVEIRFWRKVDPDFATKDCWEWIGSKDSHGYGQMIVQSKLVQAHRVSWTLFKTNIPRGMCVLHRCDNRRCVRPGHLFLGTKQDNADDAIAKGRTLRKTHCMRGHELTADNIYATTTNHGKQCKLCAKIRRQLK